MKSPPGVTPDEPGSWVGNSECERDFLSPSTIAKLRAVIDRDKQSGQDETAPHLSHWLYFHHATPQRGLSADGHEERGRFLPPIALPRRMWAGSTITFHQPLRLGTWGERRSTVKSVTPKQGRSGKLVFVSVEHQISGEAGLALTEVQDIVYRMPANGTLAAQPSQASTPSAQWTRTLRPDAVMLFRYSALTFNGHRIHYDRDYARHEEGYPGLVVHGPLIATLLMDHLSAQCPGYLAKTARIRAVSPVFEDEPLVLNGHMEADRRAELWATDSEGRTAMSVSVELR